MRLKTKLLFLCFFLAGSLHSLAPVDAPFQSWGQLIDQSPDILVGRCTKVPISYIAHKQGSTNVIEKLWAPTGEIEVVTSLKGRTNTGFASVCTFSHVEMGDYYLIFSHYQDGQYRAISDYRFVHLGTNFSTNQIVGRTLDEKNRGLLQHGLSTLEQQPTGDPEQKKRLEEGSTGNYVHEAEVIRDLMRQASNGIPRFEK